MNFRRYALIALAMLVIDWALGGLRVAGLAPLWSFLVINFPFGLPLVWLESHWTGTQYVVAGQNIDETWSLVAFLSSVFAQAWLYAWLLGHWRSKPHRLAAA